MFRERSCEKGANYLKKFYFSVWCGLEPKSTYMGREYVSDDHLGRGSQKGVNAQRYSDEKDPRKLARKHLSRHLSLNFLTLSLNFLRTFSTFFTFLTPFSELSQDFLRKNMHPNP